MIEIDVRVDAKQVQATLAQWVKGQEVAIARALNKTAMQARTEASREVRDQGYQIKASAIKKSFSIDRATQHKLVVTLTATGAPIGLINYGARQVGSGVSVNVKNGRKVVAHAFIADMRNGHRGVFKRKPGMQMGRRGRLILNRKIVEKFGPSIPSALANDVVIRALVRKINEKFPQILAHEIAFLSMSAK